MPKYNPPIESRSTNELVIIAHSSEEEWQNEAISAARLELQKRDISTFKQQELLKEIEERIKQENLIELERRKVEDYSIIDMVFIVLRWPVYMFHDWGLKREGYHLKFRRRLQLIGLGIFMTAMIFIWASYEAEDAEKKRLEEIEAVDISDWEKNRIKK